jgi:tRNA-splicing ligase RtcB
MDACQQRARALAKAAGDTPDARMSNGTPAWLFYREQAKRELIAEAYGKGPAGIIHGQPIAYSAAPLNVLGDHETSTLTQMQACMQVGNVVAGVVCADGHLGYAQPVGGVIAYDGQISVSGVGFDIGCGCLGVQLDVPYATIKDRVGPILRDITAAISFGIGRSNQEPVEHMMFDDADWWRRADREDYRQRAQAQLGTVGGGNHYVDLLRDETGMVWIGVHFGSRGLGHTTATKYIKAAGGKDGIHVPPVVLDVPSEIGQRYLSAMELCGTYAYAGRRWVADRVRQIIGGHATDSVHNHHNYAWHEMHIVEGQVRDLWVVRKGATPAFPWQRGFVGGSMGDDAVILQGVDSPAAAAALYSTVHGAGRNFGRMEAKRRFTRAEMDAWLAERGVLLAGGGVDESPMAYRRLPEVLAHHAGTIKVLHTLRPFAVAMAGNEADPWKD